MEPSAGIHQSIISQALNICWIQGGEQQLEVSSKFLLLTKKVVPPFHMFTKGRQWFFVLVVSSVKLDNQKEWLWRLCVRLRVTCLLYNSYGTGKKKNHMCRASTSAPYMHPLHSKHILWAPRVSAPLVSARHKERRPLLSLRAAAICVHCWRDKRWDDRCLKAPSFHMTCESQGAAVTTRLMHNIYDST